MAIVNLKYDFDVEAEVARLVPCCAVRLYQEPESVICFLSGPFAPLAGAYVPKPIWMQANKYCFEDIDDGNLTGQIILMMGKIIRERQREYDKTSPFHAVDSMQVRKMRFTFSKSYTQTQDIDLATVYRDVLIEAVGLNVA